jgi:aminomethyltransferase
MVDFAGWEMPIQYTSIIEEHQAVRSAVGIFDISHMGRLLFQGPASSDFIQRLFTNDAAKMEHGQVRYGFICNEEGGILDDVLIYHFRGPYWLMVVNASNREKIVNWINQHRPKSGINIKDMTFERAMVAIQGPRACEVAKTTQASDWWRVLPPWDGLKYYHAQFVGGFGDEAHGDAIISQTLTISRTGYTGEDGFEMVTTAGYVQQLVDALYDSARQLGNELKPCGLGARDTLRLEAGMPLYGHELTEDIDPFQAGLGWAVKMDKGDFIGRAALARRRQDQSLRQRVGLELEGKRLAREGASVMKGDKVIGTVTSGTFAPTLAKAIAMAYVDRAWSGLGTACEVDVRGKPAAARVVPLPFYKRTKS